MAYLASIKKESSSITNGHIIQLSPLERPKDLKYELVQVEQSIREPLIHAILYTIEISKHGYLGNKHEREACARAGNKPEDKLGK